jgi:hypothetical protein
MTAPRRLVRRSSTSEGGSNPFFPCGSMDCFASLAMTLFVRARPSHCALAAISDSNFKQRIHVRRLAARCVRVLHEPPPKREGAGECRVRAAPAVSCAKVHERNAHEHTGSAETLRHPPRNGFTAYAALSPATNSSCHRRCRLDGGIGSGRIDLATGSLTPATGARTTRFCRTLWRRSSCAPLLAHGKSALRTHARRRCRVHRIPSRVRDDRDTPLLPGQDGEASRVDLPDATSGIFLLAALDRAKA